jgi:hypothetical protein
MFRKITFLISFVLLMTVQTAYSAPVPFKMYPNPLTGELIQVNFESEFKAGQVYNFVITNVIGQVVFTYQLTDEEVKRGYFTVKLENLKLDKGVYLAKMVNGDNSSVQKLVVR